MDERLKPKLEAEARAMAWSDSLKSWQRKKVESTIGTSSRSEATVFAAFVICKNPIDHPGKFVVRRHFSDAQGNLIADTMPLAVADTLKGARTVLGRNLVRGPMMDNDDPVIVEWYFTC